MDEFWKALKDIGADFVQNTGLAIVRTVAFLVLGLIVIKIVQIIARSAALKSNKLDRSASTFVISIITVVLYVALVIILVSSLGFSTAGIIAAFSAVALAIALALKDSLASLANGVIIIFTKPFKKGDYISIGGIEGLVQDIRLFNTKVLTYSNEEIIVPNSEVLGDKLINYTYHCILSKEGKLSLIHPADTANYSPIQEYLYRYMTAPTMGMTYPYQPGIVLIDGKNHPVNSYVTIQFKEERYKSKVNKGYLNVTIKKSKKTGAWEILADKSDAIRCMTCQDSDALKTDLENAIYDCPDLQNLTGVIILKVVVYERRLHSNVSEEITLPHYFELSYLKKGFWDDEYIPLKYEVTL